MVWACMDGPLRAEACGDLSFGPVARLTLTTLCRRSRAGEAETSTLKGNEWWTSMGSNHRPLAYQASALPLS
ncbi:hypothetical protein D3C71_2127590 [compost metagenome]